jgi:hypothetical protein
MTTEYKQLVSTVSIDIIMREWLKDYSLTDPKVEMISKDWYYDPVKGMVVVVINVKEES